MTLIVAWLLLTKESGDIGLYGQYVIILHIFASNIKSTELRKSLESPLNSSEIASKQPDFHLIEY